VALGRCVGSIQGIGRAGHSRVEPESHQRTIRVVVDGLWNTDHWNTPLVHLLSDAQGPVPATRDETNSLNYGVPPRVMIL
jgi:hypothetical protein